MTARFEELRIEKDKRQGDIANILKVKRNTYSKWENEINDMPVEQANVLANYYKVTFDYMLGLTRNKNTTDRDLLVDWTLFSERLAKLRKDAKLSQEQVSEKLGEEYNKLIQENPEKEKEYKISKMSYIVFNGDLIDGLVNDKVEQKQEIISNDYIQNIINNIGVGYKEEGEEAYYSPYEDIVVLPPSNSFKTSNSYYATQLHELAHSTGHESRLSRNLKNKFGTEEYAKEELRAEISSSFLMQKFHLDEDKRHLDNHKSYVKNWLELLKNSPQELFNAITDANKIVDYLDDNSIKKDKFITNELEQEMEMEI